MEARISCSPIGSTTGSLLGKFAGWRKWRASPNRLCATRISPVSVFPASTFLPTLNLIEPPWYGPVCPVVWEGWRREVSPDPDLRRILSVPARSGGGRLTERIPAIPPRLLERVFMPQFRPSRRRHSRIAGLALLKYPTKNVCEEDCRRLTAY